MFLLPYIILAQYFFSTLFTPILSPCVWYVFARTGYGNVWIVTVIYGYTVVVACIFLYFLCLTNFSFTHEEEPQVGRNIGVL